jgi:hypothetical protein
MRLPATTSTASPSNCRSACSPAMAQVHPATDAKAVIGTYGTTSRPRIKVQPTTARRQAVAVEQFRSDPAHGQSADQRTPDRHRRQGQVQHVRTQERQPVRSYLLDPLLARVLNAAYGGAVAIPTAAAPRPAAAGDLYRADLPRLHGRTSRTRSPICCGSTPAFRPTAKATASVWASWPVISGAFPTAAASPTT